MAEILGFSRRNLPRHIRFSIPKTRYLPQAHTLSACKQTQSQMWHNILCLIIHQAHIHSVYNDLLPDTLVSGLMLTIDCSNTNMHTITWLVSRAERLTSGVHLSHFIPVHFTSKQHFEVICFGYTLHVLIQYRGCITDPHCSLNQTNTTKPKPS